MAELAEWAESFNSIQLHALMCSAIASCNLATICFLLDSYDWKDDESRSQLNSALRCISNRIELRDKLAIATYGLVYNYLN